MKSYWNNLFAERKHTFSHEACLDQDISQFTPGKLLDIGAGDGRNAFFLVDNGFHVTCMDYSEEGLKKIERKACDHGYHINTLLRDVINDDLSDLNKSFDTVTLIHFFPGVPALKKLVQLLRENGTLYCVTFISDNFEPGSSKHSIGISREEIAMLRSTLQPDFERFDYGPDDDPQIGFDPADELYCFVLRWENL